LEKAGTTMALKKFVILSASTKGRNDRVAKILKESIQKNCTESKVTHIDSTKYMGFFVRKKYIEAYNQIIKKHPVLWGYMFGKSDHGKKGSKIPDLGYALQDLFSQKLRKKIKELNPDYIIFTHFLPAEQLNRAKDEKLASLYVNVVTDFDVHCLWTQKNVDMFFLPTKESASRLAAFGVPKDRIHVSGVPVTNKIKIDLDKNAIRRKLNLKEDKFTIFVMTGGYGVGDVSYTAEQILENCGENVQIIALNEKNDASRKYMKKIKERYPGRIISFDDNKVHVSYMAASDVVITKADGIILAECLAMGLPVICANPIPGEEERNIEYLVEKGVGSKVYDMTGLTFRINALIQDPELFEHIRKKSLGLSNKDAADTIIKTIISK
jgi:processive 1,2-diacylglycerol beta-glucosyltransferase